MLNRIKDEENSHQMYKVYIRFIYVYIYVIYNTHIFN
jgi:hypothetical protein